MKLFGWDKAKRKILSRTKGGWSVVPLPNQRNLFHAQYISWVGFNSVIQWYQHDTG